MGFTDFHHDDFAHDPIALLDHLNVTRPVAVIGWGDGEITVLNLAMNYSCRMARVLAHGANIQANMSLPGTNGPISNSDTGSFDSDFKTNCTTSSVNGNLTKRAESDGLYRCTNVSPIPRRCKAMNDAVFKFAFQDVEQRTKLGSRTHGQIKGPVWIVDGDHDTEIERNQVDAMAAWIPYAGQLLLPQVGHATLLQDSKSFNFAVDYFLNMAYNGVVPHY